MFKRFTSTAKGGRSRRLLTLLGALAAAVGVWAGVGLAAPTPPPAPTISAHPANLTNQTSASFSYTDSKPITKFQCSLDGSSFTTCGMTTPNSKSYSGLIAGAHTFQVEAVATSGTSSPASFTWTVDLTPPTLSASSIARIGPNPTNANTLQWTVTFSKAVLNVVVGDFGLAHSNTGGTAPKITFVTPATGPSATYTVTASTAGTTGADTGSIGLNLTSKGSITDQAGNSLAGSPPIVGQAYTFDTTPPPVPTISSGPPALTNYTTATLAFSDGQIGATLLCRLDAGAFAVCTSPKSYSGLANGSHAFQVVARDAAGNQSSLASWSWTVNTLPPPAPTITSGPVRPPLGSSSTSARFTFAAGVNDGDADDAGLGTGPTVGFLCSLDSAPFQACTSPTTYTGLAQGTHTFRVEALDGAGNASTPASWTWIVDTIAPIVTFTQTPSVTTASGSSTFAWTGTDGPNGSGIALYFCRLDTGMWSLCSSPRTFAVPNGQHAFSVFAIDWAGNLSTPISYSWTVGVVAGQPYTISGSVTSNLYPGAAPRSINLTFSNPNIGNGGSGGNGVQVSNLTVAIQSIAGPNITATTPCTAADYAIAQFSGSYPLYIPQGTSSLSSLGFASSTWPTIQMLDRPANQDGCIGATVTLKYSGTP